MFKSVYRFAIIGMLLTFSTGLFSCASSETTSQRHLNHILTLKKQWEAHPEREQTLSELAAACDEALSHTPRSVALDLMMAEVLANVLLRPDLGLPLFEAHLNQLNTEQERAYWSALLRAQQVDKLTAQLEVHVQDNIPKEHPVATLLAHRAKTERSVSWDVWLHELNGVVLFESAPTIGRRLMNRKVPNLNLLLKTMQTLLPSWSIRMSIAEQRKQIDPDPWTTLGPTPISSGKKQLIAYTEFAPNTLASAPLKHSIQSDRRFTAVFEWEHPSGGQRVLSCIDAQRVDTHLLVINACSDRFTHLLDAMDALERGLDIPINEYRALILP